MRYWWLNQNQCSGNRRVELNFEIKRMEAELAAISQLATGEAP
jgi:hypothetical protein